MLYADKGDQRNTDTRTMRGKQLAVYVSDQRYPTSWDGERQIIFFFIPTPALTEFSPQPLHCIFFQHLIFCYPKFCQVYLLCAVYKVHSSPSKEIEGEDTMDLPISPVRDRGNFRPIGHTLNVFCTQPLWRISGKQKRPRILTHRHSAVIVGKRFENAYA